jgi:hypothetical protein
MVATQAEIIAELNKRNYYPDTTVKTDDTIPPPEDKPFIEKYGTLMLLLFGGGLLLSVFPGQGGQ